MNQTMRHIISFITGIALLAVLLINYIQTGDVSALVLSICDIAWLIGFIVARVILIVKCKKEERHET